MRAGRSQDGKGWAQESFVLTVVRLKRPALQPAQGCRSHAWWLLRAARTRRKPRCTACGALGLEVNLWGCLGCVCSPRRWAAVGAAAVRLGLGAVLESEQGCNDLAGSLPLQVDIGQVGQLIVLGSAIDL